MMMQYSSILLDALDSHESYLRKLEMQTYDSEMRAIIHNRLSAVESAREEIATMQSIGEEGRRERKEQWLKEKLVGAMKEIARLENELEKKRFKFCKW